MKRNNRLINTLLSVGLCVGLIFAYNLMTARETLPANTRISYEAKGCVAPCPVYRADVFADGTVIWQGVYGTAVTGTHRYHISHFALRRMMRAFKRADVFNLNVADYSARNTGRGLCTLAVQSGPQRISIRQACGMFTAQTIKPIEALERAAHIKALVLGDRAVVAHLKLEPYVKPKNGSAYWLVK